MEPTYSRPLAIARLAALYALVAVMVWFASPTGRSVAIGAVFVAAGEAIRFWAAGHLLKTSELVTSGPYRFTRNPLYLGRLLIFTGLGIMTTLPYGANWIALALGYLVFFGYYLPRKERVEPARLAHVHGEAYERYRRSVPALFPTLRPYPASSGSGWSSDRMLRNREHWMVVGLTVIVLFLLWRANLLEEQRRYASGPAEVGAPAP
jgi:protein-S-isoprenylcysteine O-methyltransferase Ste14